MNKNIPFYFIGIGILIIVVSIIGATILNIHGEQIDEIAQTNYESQNREKERMPTQEDIERLEKCYEELQEHLGTTQTLKEEISELFNQVVAAKVCSKTNRYFNALEEKCKQYEEQLSEIQQSISKYEEAYQEYLELLNNIPSYAITVKEEKQLELESEIKPIYDKVCAEKQSYLEEEESIDTMYIVSKQKADALFEEYFDLMCHLVNAEAGSSNCTSMERCYVANIVENRIESTWFKQNNIYDVIYAPGQYACVTNKSINLRPSAVVKQDVENYLRGRVETGMPSNVVYQALFSQESGIWMYMPASGHYFCYH